MTDLYQLYEEQILDHNKSPRNRRRLEDADRRADGYNPLCGDKITVFVKLNGDVVEEVTFEGSGCAISTASASMMTQSLKGKTLAEARSLFAKFRCMITGDPCEITEGPGLGKLEVFSGVCQYPARVKCATLAWHTVNSALEDAGDEIVTTE